MIRPQSPTQSMTLAELVDKAHSVEPDSRMATAVFAQLRAINIETTIEATSATRQMAKWTMLMAIATAFMAVATIVIALN